MSNETCYIFSRNKCFKQKVLTYFNGDLDKLAQRDVECHRLRMVDAILFAREGYC